MSTVKVQKLVNVINRTTGPLDAMVDGQPLVLLPGYMKHPETGEVIGAGPGGSVVSNPLPYFAAEMVKRQNPLMGSEDPENPAAFDSLIGVEQWGDDLSALEQSDATERMDRELLDDEAQSAKQIRTTSGRRDARNKKKGRARVTDHRLKNPVGIKADFND